MKHLTPIPPLRRFVASSLPRFLPLSLLLLATTVHASLDSDIQKILDEKPMQGRQIGIEIVRLSATSSTPIYTKDPATPRRPASNLKVVTTSAALSTLGPNFKFRTKLLLHNQDLILVGDGDPSFGDSEFLAGTSWTPTTVFKHWADELKKKNITSINNLLVDDSVFDTTFLHPNWSADQYMQPHSAEVAGLSLNANLVNVTVHGKGNPASYSLDPASRTLPVENTCKVGGSGNVVITREKDDPTLLIKGSIKSGGSGTYQCTIHDPSLFAAGALADVLESAGVHLTGKILRDRTASQTPGSTTIGTHETPLTAVISHANKVSQNLYAESLCKRLGHHATNQPGSWENGTAAVSSFLKSLDIPDSQYHLDDGCGLSRNNSISPHAITTILSSNFHSPSKDPFMKSLAVGGVDGTLEHRFTEKDLKSKVLAKTGFIEGVSALSGYLLAKDGNTYAFSILINNIPAKSNSIYKEAQERILRALNNSTTK